MTRDGFKTVTGRPVRMRVTLTVDAGSQKDLEKALDEAVLLGKDRYMGIAYHWKRKGGARISCRTTRTRPRKEETIK